MLPSAPIWIDALNLGILFLGLMGSMERGFFERIKGSGRLTLVRMRGRFLMLFLRRRRVLLIALITRLWEESLGLSPV